MIGTDRNPEGGVHDIPREDSGPSGDRHSQSDHQFSERPHRGLRILPLSAVLERPAIEWLIENALAKNGIAVLYGPSGIGKTFVAIEFSLSVATGTPWRGFEVIEGVVLYIVAEGIKGIGKRLKAWLGDRLNNSSDPIFERFFVIEEAVNFLDQASINALVAAIREMKVQPVLVVIDTLARCMAGGDENSAQHMGMFIEGCDRLRQLSGAAVVVVHHTTKKGNSERGSSALRGGADTMLELSEDESGVRKLTCDKQKDADPFVPKYFILQQVEVETAGDGTAITSCILRWVDEPPPKAEPASDKPNPDYVIVWKLRERFGAQGATGPGLLEATGLDDATFYRRLKLMRERGTVEEIPGSKPVRYRLASGREQSHSHSQPSSASGEAETSHSQSQSRAPVGGETESEAETGPDGELFDGESDETYHDG